MKNIQHDAITAANPRTKPMNSQARAPRGPMHPPEYASPRIWAFDTILILLKQIKHF